MDKEKGRALRSVGVAAAPSPMPAQDRNSANREVRSEKTLTVDSFEFK